MKKLKVYGILIIAVSMIFISCGRNSKSDKPGGNCEYNQFEGSAKIISIKDAPKSDYNCPENPKLVIFEFTPANLSDRSKYSFKNFSDNSVQMKINDGANPSLAWIKKNKIEAGKKYRCVRTELTKGTCTPVIFEFPDLDLAPSTGCK